MVLVCLLLKGQGAFCGGIGFVGNAAQVQLSLEGKYGMAFLGNRLLSTSHFLMNEGQKGGVLGC